MSLSIDQLNRSARRPAGAAALTLLLGLGAPAPASAAQPDITRSCARYASDGVRVAECVEQLRIARDATAKYRDPQVALRDGFVKTDDCEDSAHHGEDPPLDPALGAVGEHWVRPDRMADERLDPREPEILLYLNTPRGRRLVAVEWSFQRIQRGPPLVGGLPYYGSEPPDRRRITPAPKMFGGKTFDGPMQGHHTHQPWHYDLHVWLWERNPAGIFAKFNRRVSCEDGVAPEGKSTGPGDDDEPRITITGTPARGSCTTRDFTARVSVRDESALRRARLYVDGRKVHETSKNRFSKRIDASAMRRGRHRLTVVATDRAGNTGRRIVDFARCHPRFAG